MIFSSDLLSPHIQCPKCDKCKVNFIKPKKSGVNPYFATDCGIQLQRSWSLLTASTKHENCMILVDPETKVNFTLDTLSAVRHMNEPILSEDSVTIMLGLKEEVWDIPKQQLFTTFFSIDQDFKEMMKCIIQNKPFDRLKYIAETEDTAESFLWLAKQDFPEDDNNLKHIFPIDVSFWIFSICGGEVTAFEDLEYFKSMKEKKTLKDPLEQLRQLVSLAEEAAEEGNKP